MKIGLTQRLHQACCNRRKQGILTVYMELFYLPLYLASKYRKIFSNRFLEAEDFEETYKIKQNAIAQKVDLASRAKVAYRRR